MRKPPTMIADYSRVSSSDSKKLDKKFYRFPGDDKPVKTGAAMFPAGVVRVQDGFDKKPTGALSPADIKASYDVAAASAPAPKSPTRKRRLLQCLMF